MEGTIWEWVVLVIKLEICSVMRFYQVHENTPRRSEVLLSDKHDKLHQLNDNG